MRITSWEVGVSPESVVGLESLYRESGAPALEDCGDIGLHLDGAMLQDTQEGAHEAA